MTADTTNLESNGVEQNPEKAPTSDVEQKEEGAAKVSAYTIVVATGEVLGHRTKRDAAAYAATSNGAVIDVTSEKDLRKVPGPILVKVYNFAASQAPAGEPRAKELTRFSDQDAAARRTWPVVEYLGENRRAPITPTLSNEDTTVSTKTKSKKKTTAKKAATGERKARTGGLAGMIIEKLGKYESGRAESARTKNFALIRDGMKASDFIAKGGSHIDLVNYVRVGAVKLKKA